MKTTHKIIMTITQIVENTQGMYVKLKEFKTVIHFNIKLGKVINLNRGISLFKVNSNVPR